MPTTAVPSRARRSFWLDPRFVIGIVLVAASVGGVYAVVTVADRTTTVYTAASHLTPGQRVTEGDLRPAEVRLGSAGTRYLTSARMPDGGVIMTRTVASGELIPLSAVGRTEGARRTSVVITVHGALAGTVVPGAVVDVWSAAELEHGSYGAPVVLADSATVVRLITGTGVVATGDSVSVEVRISRSRVAAVLQAQANGDVLSVVPASIPVGQ